ncbi:MAG: hypothetical protein IM318_13130 [Microcystis sp. M017S1]|jgi:hypothetical protein|nr:hypothetical protein [Microcystis sp. M017S1]MCA3171425.1 hypothetical protein [Burkholderiales bacterium]
MALVEFLILAIYDLVNVLIIKIAKKLGKTHEQAEKICKYFFGVLVFSFVALLWYLAIKFS